VKCAGEGKLARNKKQNVFKETMLLQEKRI
jgi:hypothetical protein